jgi:phosphoenolpyruvate carboxylase
LAVTAAGEQALLALARARRKASDVSAASEPWDALRANVRLLGAILGEVIVEQEGVELLELEERVRKLARAGRRGYAAAMDQLVELVSSLELEQQALVLRAFAIYFQLANVAEQHHRVRRRRAYEREGRTPPESLADARERIGAVDASHIRVELVLTAHPTEATRRTILRLHRRVASLLRELDDAELAPSDVERIRRELAVEITIMWQTDEVRSTRPRVVDEIRHGLWFFEQSLWEEAPRLLGALRELDPAAAAAPRFGSWIGGDLDGNPHAGGETVTEALEQARRLARDLVARDVRELARSWGMST